jgi:predicted RNA binding protein YcfA (HicA-like mRNA interferase family)
MKLPVVSGKEFVKRLKWKGYVWIGQEGSHMIIRLDVWPHSKLSVPDHKELDRGLLRALIRDANLTVEGFVSLKKKPR